MRLHRLGEEYYLLEVEVEAITRASSARRSLGHIAARRPQCLQTVLWGNVGSRHASRWQSTEPVKMIVRFGDEAATRFVAMAYSRSTVYPRSTVEGLAFRRCWVFS